MTDADSRFLTRKRVMILFAVAAVGLGSVALVDRLLTAPPANLPAGQPMPPAVQEPVVDTDLNQVKQALGPFETIEVSADSPAPDTRHPAVLLLGQDGSTQASTSWTIPFNGETSWKQGDVSQVRSISVELGYITFGTNLGRTFVVRANQPLIFEEVPEQVVLMDAQGNTWSTTMSRAQASRQPLQ